MYVVAATSVAGLATVAYTYMRYIDQIVDPIDKRRLRASTIRTGGTVLWPTALLGALAVEARRPGALWVPLAWSGAIWALDSYMLNFLTSKEKRLPASIRLDVGAFAPMTFGLASLVGSRTDGRFTYLFVYAVVGALLVVLPTHNLEDDSIAEQIFESTQKAALVWCIGFLVAAVTLMHSPTKAA